MAAAGEWKIIASWVHSFSLGRRKSVVEMNDSDDWTIWMYLMPPNYTLKNGYNSKFYVMYHYHHHPPPHTHKSLPPALSSTANTGLGILAASSLHSVSRWTLTLGKSLNPSKRSSAHRFVMRIEWEPTSKCSEKPKLHLRTQGTIMISHKPARGWRRGQALTHKDSAAEVCGGEGEGRQR